MGIDLDAQISATFHASDIPNLVKAETRAELETPRLARVLAPSPEEDRLLQVYRRKGLKALIDDLKR